MQRTKYLGAILCAAFAVACMASGSASAAECVGKAKSGIIKICVEKQPLHTTVGVTPTLSGTATFVLPPSWEVGQVSCTSSTESFGGTKFINLGTAPGTEYFESPIKFENCKIEGSGSASLAKKCVAHVRFTELEGVFGTTPSSMSLKGERAIEVGRLSFENKGTEVCPPSFRREIEMSGKWECKIQEAEVELVEHELTCEATNTFLIEGAKTGLSYKQKLALSGAEKGKKYKVYEASSLSE